MAAAGSSGPSGWLRGLSVSEQRRLSVLAGWCCRSRRHSGPSSALLPTRPFSPAVPWPGCSLDDNGVEFPVGQIWSPGDPCELCICQVNDNLRAFSCFPHPSPSRAGQPCPCGSGATSGLSQSRFHAIKSHFYRRGWDPGYSVLGRFSG